MSQEKAETPTCIVYRDKDLQERIDKLLEEETCCDVTFLLDDGKHKVTAHKLFLVASSPVFKKMFTDPTQQSSEVVISDPKIDVTNFRTFIKSLTTGKVEISMENAMQQLYLGHEYEVFMVWATCCIFLKKSLNFSNVFDILPVADFYGSEDLKEACIITIGHEFSGKAKDVKLFSKLPFEHSIAVIDYLLSREKQNWVLLQAHKFLRAFKAHLLEESNGRLRKRAPHETKASTNQLEKGFKRKLGDE